MTPLLLVSTADKCDEWMTMDLRAEADVSAIVMFPLYGNNHRAGLDCWCEPKYDDGVIFHHVTH